MVKKINDTTEFALTTPELDDFFLGTDVSNTTLSVDGQSVNFTFQATMDLFEANMSVPVSVANSYQLVLSEGPFVDGDKTKLDAFSSANTYQQILSEGPFVDGDKTKLDAFSSAGTYQQILSEGPFVDGDKTKLDAFSSAGTYQEILSEGPFVDGDKTKLDAFSSANTYQEILSEGPFVDGDKTKLDTFYGPTSFASRVDAQAATVDPDIPEINVLHNGVVCTYRRDSGSTALQTANGESWGPASKIAFAEHWGLSPIQFDVDDLTANTNPGTAVSGESDQTALVNTIFSQHEGVIHLTGLVRTDGEVLWNRNCKVKGIAGTPVGAGFVRYSNSNTSFDHTHVGDLGYNGFAAEDLLFYAHQPTDAASKSALTRHPWAIKIRNSARSVLKNITIVGYLNGIDGREASPSNSGGTILNQIQCGTFGVGLFVDESYDYFTVKEFRSWPFISSIYPDLLDIWQDDAIEAVRIERADGFDGEIYTWQTSAHFGRDAGILLTLNGDVGLEDRGDTISQTSSGASGTIEYVIAGPRTQIKLKDVSGTFDTGGQLTSSANGGLGANSVPSSVETVTALTKDAIECNAYIALDGPKKSQLELKPGSGDFKVYSTKVAESNPSVIQTGGRYIIQPSIRSSTNNAIVVEGGEMLLHDGWLRSEIANTVMLDTQGGRVTVSNCLLQWPDTAGQNSAFLRQSTSSAQLQVVGCSTDQMINSRRAISFDSDNLFNFVKGNALHPHTVDFNLSWVLGYYDDESQSSITSLGNTSYSKGVISDTNTHSINTTARRARGTRGAPADVQSGDVIANDLRSAWANTAFHNILQEKDSVDSISGNNVSGKRELFIANTSGSLQKIYEATTSGINFPVPATISDRHILHYNDPTDHGAIGQYGTDDGAALQTWLNSFDGTPLYIRPDKVFYVEDRTLLLPDGVIIKGASGAKLAPYNQRDTEKEKLSPGNKDSLSGSVIIFGGSGAIFDISTGRSGNYESVEPMMYYDHKTPCHLSGFTMIADIDVFDANGDINTANTDNRQTAYNSGLVTKGYGTVIDDFCFFGNMSEVGGLSTSRASGLILLQAEGESTNIPDPDYITVSNSVINSGTAIIGSTLGSSSNGGLSGPRFIGTTLYDGTHTNRADTDPDIPALYIDGDTTGSNSGIRGFAMIGGGIRGVCNKLIEFDNIDDWSIIGTTIENATVNGVTGLDQVGRIHATSQTGNGTLSAIAVINQMDLETTIAEMGGLLMGNFNALNSTFFAQGGSGDANTVSIALSKTDGAGGTMFKVGRNFSAAESGQVTYVKGGEIELGGVIVKGETVVVDNDTVSTLTPPSGRNMGHAELIINGDKDFPNKADCATIWYDVGTSAESGFIGSESLYSDNISFSDEGTLTGTTGADGTMTIAAQDDGTIDIENRLNKRITIKVLYKA